MNTNISCTLQFKMFVTAYEQLVLNIPINDSKISSEHIVGIQ